MGQFPTWYSWGSFTWHQCVDQGNADWIDRLSGGYRLPGSNAKVNREKAAISKMEGRDARAGESDLTGKGKKIAFAIAFPAKIWQSVLALVFLSTSHRSFYGVVGGWSSGLEYTLSSCIPRTRCARPCDR